MKYSKTGYLLKVGFLIKWECYVRMISVSKYGSIISKIQANHIVSNNRIHTLPYSPSAACSSTPRAPCRASLWIHLVVCGWRLFVHNANLEPSAAHPQVAITNKQKALECLPRRTPYGWKLTSESVNEVLKSEEWKFRKKAANPYFPFQPSITSSI